MKKVYCYFEALADGPPHQGELIRLWHRSWTRHGWDVRMLSPRTLWRSRLLDHIPTGCDHQTQREFRRQLSLIRVGGGLLVHYDVINFGLKPSHFKLTRDSSSTGLLYRTRDSARMLRKQFRPVTAELVNYVTEFDEPGWNWTSLVHFSTQACQGLSKFEVIERCDRPI